MADHSRSHHHSSPSPDRYAPYDPSPVDPVTGEQLRTAKRARRPHSSPPSSERRSLPPPQFETDAISLGGDSDAIEPDSPSDNSVDGVPMEDEEAPRGTPSRESSLSSIDSIHAAAAPPPPGAGASMHASPGPSPLSRPLSPEAHYATVALLPSDIRSEDGYKGLFLSFSQTLDTVRGFFAKNRAALLQAKASTPTALMHYSLQFINTLDALNDTVAVALGTDDHIDSASCNLAHAMHALERDAADLRAQLARLPD